MNDSDDIANLFKQFGGQADQYRELGRENDAKLSRERWPLLSSVEARQPTDAPPVQHRDGLTQPVATGLGLAALRSGPPAMPATPVMPAAAPAPGVASSPPAPAAPKPSMFGFGARLQRKEPSLRADIAPAVVPAPVAPTPVTPPATPVAAPAAPLSAAAPKPPSAEFIPPRAQPSTRFAHRVPAQASAPFERMVPGPDPMIGAATPALSPASAAVPAAPRQHPAGANPLQSVFARLSQPEPEPEPPKQADRSSSLLQRLRSL